MYVGTSEGQKMALDALDLELQTVKGCQVGAGNHTWLLEGQGSYLLSHLTQAPVNVNFYEKTIYKISHINIYF